MAVRAWQGEGITITIDRPGRLTGWRPIFEVGQSQAQELFGRQTYQQIVFGLFDGRIRPLRYCVRIRKASWRQFPVVQCYQNPSSGIPITAQTVFHRHDDRP